MISQAALADLRSAVRGSVLAPGDAAYDETRKVFNAMIDHQPALIARCVGAADVIASVRSAEANGLAVSARGGGHNVSGRGVVDGGLMIDLSPMKGCRVDPVRRTGHKLACDRCGHQESSYNSCPNRHCPKCQAAARAEWLAEREAELLDVTYFHVVFTLPEELALGTCRRYPATGAGLLIPSPSISPSIRVVGAPSQPGCGPPACATNFRDGTLARSDRRARASSRETRAHTQGRSNQASAGLTDCLVRRGA
jgi:hypothetical protein